MFVLVFMVFYGMVGYFVPLLLAASYQEIASEAAREAVLHNYDAGGQTRRSELVREVVNNSWLPAPWKQTCSGYSDYLKETDNALSTCLSHNQPSSIIPQISLFGWRFPVLPEAITGEATILRRPQQGAQP